MIDADAHAFATLMLGLGETYAEAVSDVRIEIYFAALKDLPIEAVRQAATAHVRFSKFFPRPSELREAVVGSVNDRAEVAWLAVQRLVRRVGYYATPDETAWPDPAAKRAALELFGGWKALCEKLPSEGPELLGFRKSFLAAYRAYDGRAQREALPAGEPGRELSPDEARQALGDLKVQIQKRGLPTGAL